MTRWTIAWALAAACVGCDSASRIPDLEMSAATGSTPGSPDSVPTAIPPSPAAGALACARPPANDEAIVRRMIYAARLRVAVAGIDEALAAARMWTEECGGYLQEQTRDRAVLRVPAARFRLLLDRLEGLGNVTDREIRAEDVTEQHVDLQARLANARAVAARLQEMLAAARDVKEALEVEAELRRLGEEIERMEGRLRLLERQVAYSTITVELSGRAPAQTAIAPRVRLPFRWMEGLDLERLIGQASRGVR